MISARLSLFAILPVLCAMASHAAERIASPDGQLVAIVEMDGAGVPTYSIEHRGAQVLRPSSLGLVREDADFSRGLRLQSISPAESVDDRYELLTSKRRLNHY